MVITLWLVLSILVGVLASNYNRSGFGYFLLSVLLSPMIGLLIVLITGKKGEPVATVLHKVDPPLTSEILERVCPYCAEPVKVEALICKHCRSDIALDVAQLETIETINEMKNEKQVKTLKRSRTFMGVLSILFIVFGGVFTIWDMEKRNDTANPDWTLFIPFAVIAAPLALIADAKHRKVKKLSK